MSDLFAARSQMAISLAFHILFAVAGMAMPLLMVLAEWKGRRTGEAHYLELAKRWAKGTAILFAVGAVSGTVLSFELGLLWPRFMEVAGPLIGMPFSLEGAAFFLEAIFLGIYLYGWDKVSPRVHLFSGVMVAVSGVASGVFVVAVNSFMNAPAGFTLVDGVITDVNPWGPFLSPAFPTQATHMAIAAYMSIAACVLGVHAWALLKNPQSRFHRAAFGLAFGLLAVTSPLQALSGDFAAKHVAEHQPVKFAALEALFETGPRAPLTLGGWPDEETGEVHLALHIPALGSFLAFGEMDAVVRGLNDFPREDWPPVVVTHVAFQIMVACGVALLGLVALGLYLRWRRKEDWLDPRFLKAAVVCSPLGLIAVEAGWFVTEVGRQPWIVHGLMRTSEAVTPMPQLAVPLVVFTLLYVVLGVVVVALLRWQFRHVESAP